MHKSWGHGVGQILQTDMDRLLAHEVLLAVACAAGPRAVGQLCCASRAGYSQSRSCLPEVLALCPVGIGVVGGIGAHGDALKVAEVWCPCINSWLPLPAMPTARHGCAAAAIGPRLFVVGGSDENLQRLPTVECFDTTECLWLRLPDMPTPRGNVLQ